MDTASLGINPDTLKPWTKDEIIQSTTSSTNKFAHTRIWTKVTNIQFDNEITVISEHARLWREGLIQRSRKRKKSKKAMKKVTYQKVALVNILHKLLGSTKSQAFRIGTIRKVDKNVINLGLPGNSMTVVYFQSNINTNVIKVIINMKSQTIHGAQSRMPIDPIKFSIKPGYNTLIISSMYGGCIIISNVKGLYSILTRSDKNAGSTEGSLEMEVGKQMKSTTIPMFNNNHPIYMDAKSTETEEDPEDVF